MDMSEKELPYKLAKNVLTPAQCEAYRDWIEKYASADAFRPGYRLAAIPVNELYDEQYSFLQPLRNVVNKVEEFLLLS